MNDLTTTVRIPRTSSRRSAIAFAKLLSEVKPNALNGYGFEGRFLRPGTEIPITELPERALVLEGAGSERIAGKRSSRYQYILWQFNRTSGEWQELASVWAESWEWALELGPIAEHLLNPVQPVPDLAEIAARLVSSIESVFAGLEPGQRARLAGVLHDQFATRILASSAAA